ncbi:transporter [Flavivirga jejuensis]|uniref:Transporter n=1 Tax=Flavivirga jejuensis TaxID=870487 RepID=A0ABT8WRL6_9FLAO|nr:transporter [Flavivirga jejuensis]MDO5975838.1 transporter [Flavivirga jejuensis]
MNLIKSILCFLFALISIQAYSQYTDVINSNRPGVSRSAFSVGTKVAQFEVGPYIINEKRTPATAYKVSGFGVDFAVRYGLLLEELELNIEGTYQNDTKTYVSNFSAEDKRSNFKTIAFGAKYLVYDPYKNSAKNKPNLYSWKANHSFRWSSLIPAVSLYLGANFDTKDNPYIAPGVEGISPKVMIATQNNFPGGWVFVMNLIKDRIGSDQSDFQYILTLTHSFNSKLVIFGETQGIQSDFYADNLFRFGGAYLIGRDVQLDTAMTFNTKDTPSVFGVNLGVSYRLDFHKDKKIKDKNIDNGNSAKEEGKRRSRRNKNKGVINTLPKKQKKNNIDFDNN